MLIYTPIGVEGSHRLLLPIRHQNQTHLYPIPHRHLLVH